MAICNFIHTYGEPPISCTTLGNWLTALAAELAGDNAIRCAEDTADPDFTDLDALWGACDIPLGAFVTWYNSTSGDTLYYVYNGTDWAELILS